MQVEYTPEQLKLIPKLADANINPDSFLATDYLNHFNEIVMLMEMIPDMPELIEDAADWKPKSYPQHFEDSGFQAKGLAIEAYEMAPTVFKAPFEQVCDEMNNLLVSTLSGLMKVNIIERGVSPGAQALIRGRIESVQTMLLKLNQIIHGKFEEEVLPAQEAESIEAPTEDVQSQEDIDKLFD
jgi:hypothetical protein